MGRFLLACVLAAASGFASLAQAAEPRKDQPPRVHVEPVSPEASAELDARKANARSLANEASLAYRGGNFSSAYDGFNRAFQLVHVPMLGVWSARSLSELGRLVEASERYRDVLKVVLSATAPDGDREAIRTADAELQALLPKIPTLTVRLDGGDVSGIILRLDGKPLAAALVGVGQKLDPGRHVIVGTRGAEQADAAVFLSEGQTSEVTLHLNAVGRAAASESAGAGGDRGRRTAGFVFMGVGAVALVGGAITLAVSLDQQAALVMACPANVCSSGQAGQVRDFELLKTLTLVGLVGGGVLEATGMTLLFTAGSPAEPQVALFTRGTSLGLGGTF